MTEDANTPEPAAPVMSRRQTWAVLLAIAVIGTAWAIFSAQRKPAFESAVEGNLPTSVQYPVMGTRASMVFYGERTGVDRALGAVRDTFLEIEKIGSLYDPGSELAKLNAMAAIEPFTCSPILWEIIAAARQAHEFSDGAFDISAKPLMDLWGFYRRRGDQPPTAREIAAAVELVGLEKVVFDDDRKSVFFPKAGMALDLGGIAKGYAVDRAAAEAQAFGVRQGIIDLGGNIRVLPQPPPGRENYRIGVRNPGRTEEVLEVELPMLNNSVATSGSYERFVILGGRKYSHILDPDSGMPVPGDHGATVVTPLALDADTLSTACFIKGPAWCEANKGKLPPHTTIYFYTKDGLSAKVERGAPEK